MDILIVAEHRQGELHRMTLEAVTAAQAFAVELKLSSAALVLGDDVDAVRATLAALDLGEVLVAQHERLRDYSSEAYTDALCQVIGREQPAWVFLAHTYQARDFLPRVSGRMGLPLLSDIIAYRSGGERPVFIKQVYSGRLSAELVSTVSVGQCLVSFQAAAYAADSVRAGSAAVRDFALELTAPVVGIQAEAPFQESAEAVDLAGADLIVSVGRGLGSEENLGVIKQLASALGAELACSRPVVDAGWMAASRQVGSSGQTVSPKLYLALGISGAAQHLVGMKGAKHIIAINKDAEAPIFDVADYGIVADLMDVAPRLTEALKAQ
ncbi:MAG: electron transfer flavoprotein subunit alpha/FixB family protein [gamma proteobacterium endosymbiont of Lamellibrachia anaximandri]|nr:electron transfer flavoprotein subunit alpha/FixB family protein [gamma proteobacterium endosymbiont of Lamellibrachia anaximandri]